VFVANDLLPCVAIGSEPFARFGLAKVVVARTGYAISPSCACRAAAVVLGRRVLRRADDRPVLRRLILDTNLGSIAGVPTDYGGLVFKAGDPNTILIGGAAASPSRRFYEVPVTRCSTGRSPALRL
jgi:hypothetical protein